MLLGGDELSRSQGGNNNAYCQDSEISWLDWSESAESGALTAFLRWMIGFRKEHSLYARSSFLTGDRQEVSGERDVSWWTAAGSRMKLEDWENPKLHQLSVIFASGDVNGDPGESLLAVWFNASLKEQRFSLPNEHAGRDWVLRLDTADPATPVNSSPFLEKSRIMKGKSLVLLESTSRANQSH